MHVKGRRRTYKVLTERPHLVHRLKPRCFLLWGVSINHCTTMPAFTGSVNPNLSYKSLVNMGQKARKHWAHAFRWMLLWFHPLKMLLQGTEHCALLSPNTGTLWVYGWTVQRCLEKKILFTLLKWLSYLSDRYFRIPINNCMSSSAHSIFGVPQGSVLGPAMYSLYMLPVGHLNSFKGIFYHC